jgi:hypothetical protein
MTTTTIESRPSQLDRPITAVIGLTWEKALYFLLILAAFDALLRPGRAGHEPR